MICANDYDSEWVAFIQYAPVFTPDNLHMVEIKQPPSTLCVIGYTYVSNDYLQLYNFQFH